MVLHSLLVLFIGLPIVTSLILNDAMSDILEKIGHHSCFVMGDFNWDLMKHDKHPPTEKFLDVMYAKHLIPVINRPTRVTMNTCTLIDNIFTNQYDVRENQLHGILKTDITDHFPLFISTAENHQALMMMIINSSV